MGQPIRDEVIEELLQGYSGPDDLLGEEGVFKELKKRLLERALGAELTEHLGYKKGDPAGRAAATVYYQTVRAAAWASRRTASAFPRAAALAYQRRPASSSRAIARPVA